MNATVTAEAQPGSGRRTLLLILALFTLPVLIAAGLFVFGWKPEKTGNYGELIQPPLLLPQAGLTGADGNLLSGEILRGKWLLLLAGSGPCDTGCRERLQHMRRVHVALNKNMDRVHRAWLNASSVADPALPQLRQEIPDLLVAQPDGPDWAALLPAAGHQLFIADPQGNVILRYPADAHAQGVRQDLERLLKYSWIG